MVLDLIENYNEQYPEDKIVRLFDFTEAELLAFSQTINAIVKDSCSIWVSDAQYIKTSEIKLLLKVGNSDIGIIAEIENEEIYHCILTIETYMKIHEQIMSLNESKMAGFHWLYDLDNNIDFLLSKTGNW